MECKSVQKGRRRPYGPLLIPDMSALLFIYITNWRFDTHVLQREDTLPQNHHNKYLCGRTCYLLVSRLFSSTSVYMQVTAYMSIVTREEFPVRVSLINETELVSHSGIARMGALCLKIPNLNRLAPRPYSFFFLNKLILSCPHS
jgi:hypothetical protein